ncbi:MAG TPA: PAS domain S-box protein [Burkholderiaceae bacterium]|nr:PAS domain S-box protein [Burkholderiaceae bacterium]
MSDTGSAAIPADLHRRIVEQADEAIIFADRDGIIRLWNRGAEKLFGYTEADALGRNLHLIVPERFRAAHDEGYRRALAAGVTRYAGRVMTTRSQTKDGARIYIDMSFGLVKDDAGTVRGAFAVARDCTARQLERMASRQGAAPGPA